MPNKPNVSTLNASTVDILNAIRNSASSNYRDYVPAATDNKSIREIGAVIMDYPSLQNEFLSALVNRIGMVLMSSKMYSNPWAVFKRGLLEYGETVEEIFVNIASPHEFDPAAAENEVFKREIPDVRAAFHPLDYTKYYKTTVTQKQLNQAFLSLQGVTDLISKIVDSMYSGANFDEFLTMKYLIAKHILRGQMTPITIQPVTSDNMNSIITDVKGVSNQFEFMKSEYNLAGVHTFSMKDDQYMIRTSNFDAKVDVEVLAAAFNMNKVEFAGHSVLVDTFSFSAADVKRMDELFADMPNYKSFTDDELKALEVIPAVLVDQSWFMIFDNTLEFTELWNPQGLSWNYWLHTWKTFSVSPFANNALFIPATPAVTSVTVTPATATAAAGSHLSLSVVVETENFAPQTVDWSSNNENVTVDIHGTVIVGDDATGEVTITATSTYDPTKSGTATITIS